MFRLYTTSIIVGWAVLTPVLSYCPQLAAAEPLEGRVTQVTPYRSDPISADKLYQREERPMGILRWEIEAPAQAAGESARLIKYHYKVEYDRQFVVSLPEGKQSLQDEFERLQRGAAKALVLCQV